MSHEWVLEKTIVTPALGAQFNGGAW
jgi:hypothetical protein